MLLASRGQEVRDTVKDLNAQDSPCKSDLAQDVKSAEVKNP